MILMSNNILIYSDDATLNSKCDQAFDLGQYLELASEFKSDLWDMWYENGWECSCEKIIF